jgi:hypothetical protein
MLVGAEAVGVALTGRAAEARALEGAALERAVLAHALASGCDGAQVQWVNALSSVMETAGPYLRGDDLVPLFQAARAGACWRSLDAGARSRVDFLEAVAVRDLARAAELANRVLEAGVRYRPDERAEVLSAGMAAALAKGDVGQAQALHDRHWRSLSAEERRSLSVLLVEAHLQWQRRR